MNDNDTMERPYALLSEPAIYTEGEMQIMVDKLQDANERLETLRTDFSNYSQYTVVVQTCFNKNSSLLVFPQIQRLLLNVCN